MSVSYVSPDCPIVTEKMLLGRWREGALPGQREFLRWEQEITWLYESNTELVFLWDNEHLDTIGSWNDYYGFLTSATDKVLEDIVKRRGLNRSDRLVLQATTKVEKYPITIIEQKGEGWRTKIERLKCEWFAGTPEQLDQVEHYDYNVDPIGDPPFYPSSVQVGNRLVCEVVTRRSDWPGEETSREIIEGLRKRFTFPEANHG